MLVPKSSLSFPPPSWTASLLNENWKKHIGLCHPNPLKHPSKNRSCLTQTFTLRNTPAWAQQADTQTKRVIFAPKFITYPVGHSISSTGHYLLPCIVISGLSSYLQSTNEGAQMQLNRSSQSFQECSFHKGKTQSKQSFHLLFIWLSLTAKELGNWKLKIGQTQESNSNANTSSVAQRQWNSTQGQRFTTKIKDH